MGLISSPTAIIFKDLNGKPKEWLIDASLQINTSLKASVTSYPVEDKAFISDHVQPEPLTIRIDGLISQSPSSFFLSIVNAGIGFVTSTAGLQFKNGLSQTFATAALAAGVAGLATQGNQALDKKASFIKLLSERGVVDNEYPKKAMLGLTYMFNDGTPFKIRTFFSDVLYENMVATSLSFSQDAKVGDSLKFSMECVKIQTIASKIDIVQGELKMSDPAGSSGTPNEDKGAKNGKKVSDEEAKSSAAFSFFN